MEIFIKNNWPLLLLVAWFAYKFLRAKQITRKLPELRKNGATLIDVRSSGEFATGNAPGTINIPLQEINSRLNEIPKTHPVVVACASGTRSGMARMILKKNGYKEVYNIGNWANFLK